MAHTYRFGIEEEYFLADRQTGRSPAEAAADRFHAAVETAVEVASPELLKGQIEIQTDPGTSFDAAHTRLRELRHQLADIAAASGLSLLSAGTHPLSIVADQAITEKTRYQKLAGKVGAMSRRAMVCAMHVHVEVPDPGRRVEIMNRVTGYLPLLLALSISSPFWQGHDSRLKAFRLGAFAEWPHMGVPSVFETQQDYERFISILVGAHVVRDASFVWWVIRPSAHYPTIEVRVCDSCTRAQDTVAIAALYRCLVRAATERPERFPRYDAAARSICVENIWQVRRHGLSARLIDAERGGSAPVGERLEAALDLVAEDADALGAAPWLARTRAIVADGTSADRQLATFRDALAEGRGHEEAIRAVVAMLVEETLA